MEILEIQTVEDRLDDYYSLINLGYEEAVKFLMNKYGEVRDDYFTKKSYQAFLKGDRKTLTKGKYSRTKEGLYCHHILENQELNLGDKNFIKREKYPFRYQEKENLVYCDILEHLILHALIAKETNGKYGVPGYETFLEPTVMDWYVDGVDPGPDWMKACKRKAFVTSDQLERLLNVLFEKVDISVFIFGESDRMLSYQLRKKFWLRLEKESETYEERKQRYELEKALREEEERREKEKKIERFKSMFPNAISVGIKFTSSRQELLNKLFEYKYSDIFSSKKELKHHKIDTLYGELLMELEEIVRDKRNY